MLKINMQEVESAIREVAQTVIVPRFRQLKAHDIHFKSEDNPVTIADQEAEIALKERLLALLPGSLVVGEEEFESNPGILRHFSSDQPVWTIDPVDGTKPFIAGEPYYGVIVSLTKQDQTVAGWLYDPTSDEFVTAEKGSGAYYKGKKLSVLPPLPPEEMTGLVGIRIVKAFQKNPEAQAAPHPRFATMLSACHDFASLVVGEPHFSRVTSQPHFHAWLEFCSPWDGSAGLLIHTESGGYTAHFDGSPVAPSHYGNGHMSAGSKESWQELRNWIATFCKA